MFSVTSLRLRLRLRRTRRTSSCLSATFRRRGTKQKSINLGLALEEGVFCDREEVFECRLLDILNQIVMEAGSVGLLCVFGFLAY